MNVLSPNDKRLIVLYELSEGGKKRVNYEDLAVGLWKRFPKDFHLKGYTEYPDTSIHRPFYTLRKLGMVDVREKVFLMTDKGVTEAEKAIRRSRGARPEEISAKLPRDVENEIKRLLTSEAFHLYCENEKDKILDTDFYNYLGTTVRSRRSDFQGRMKAVADAIKAATSPKAEKSVREIAKALAELHAYLLARFKDDIDYKLNNS